MSCKLEDAYKELIGNIIKKLVKEPPEYLNSIHNGSLRLFIDDSFFKIERIGWYCWIEIINNPEDPNDYVASAIDIDNIDIDYKKALRYDTDIRKEWYKQLAAAKDLIKNLK